MIVCPLYRSFYKQSLLKYPEGISQHLCVNCKVTLKYTISVVHEVHVNKNPVNRLTASYFLPVNRF